MATWTTAQVLNRGVSLHVERSGGAGLPPLVLLHGFTDDGRCWTPVAPAFADAFEVVTIDTRGHGRSDAPDDGYRIEVLAEDVACVVRDLGLERPILLGHSLGAITALSVAGLHPDLPARIVLEDPPPLWLHHGPTPDDAARAQATAAGIAALKRLSRDELEREVRAQSPAWREAEIEPWVEAKLAFSPRAIPLATPASLASFDMRAALRAITCPVTVLHGDAARGSMATPAALEVLRSLVPQLAVVHVPGAGHSIRRDQPERYLAAVLATLSA